QLMQAQRNRLHRVCFELLKSEWDKRENPPATLSMKLLMHAEKSGEWQAVITVAMSAARLYWKSYAEDEALEMIANAQRAIDSLDAVNGETTNETREARGEALLL